MNEDLISEEIPKEFLSTTVASIKFFKIASPLEVNFNFGQIISCQILVTKLNQLVELEDGNMIRIENLPLNNIIKIIVHHEFTPLRRFLCCLTRCQIAYLLDYKSLEIICKWQNIKDIIIDDPTECGRPELQIWNIEGNLIHIDNQHFLIGNLNERRSKGKVDAAIALTNKLKTSVWNAQYLETERQKKELFVTRKLCDITSQLGALKCKNKKENTSSVISNKPLITTNENNSSNNFILKILSTRQRILHENWVICVNVANISEKYVVSDPHMIVHCSKPVKRFTYCIKFMKIRKPGSTAQHDDSDWDITAEEIDPPILMPGKRAFLVAICCLPDFIESSVVTCDGLITFKIKPTTTDNEESNFLKQITFPSIKISSADIKSICVNLSQQMVTSGFSLDLLVLITTSLKHSFIVSSISTPLRQVIKSFEECEMISKVEVLNNFYYFDLSNHDPLHYAAFCCKPLNAQKLSFTTYTKDDNQLTLLLRNLQNKLPKDVFVLQEEPYNKEGETAAIKQTLVSHMYESISIIESKRYGDSLKTKKQKNLPEVYEDNRKNFENNRKDVILNAVEYFQWRKSLRDIQIKMELLLRQLVGH